MTTTKDAEYALSLQFNVASRRAFINAARSLDCDPLELAEALADGEIANLVEKLNSGIEVADQLGRAQNKPALIESSRVVFSWAHTARAALARLPGRKG